jgi:hypothetical protein
MYTNCIAHLAYSVDYATVLPGVEMLPHFI